MRILPAFRGPHPRRHLDRPAGPANPFESYLLVICIAQGCGVVFGFARPPSIEELLPTWLRFLWGVLLLFGGTLAVVGLYWPWDAVDSILLKRIGLIAAGGGAAAYGFALLSLGASGAIAASFNLGFTLACFTRAMQVSVALARFRRELQAIRDARVEVLGRKARS